MIEHCTFVTADGIHADPDVIDAIARAGTVISALVGMLPGIPPPPRVAAVLPQIDAVIRQLCEAGLPIVCGTDAGIDPAKPHHVLPYGVEALAGIGGYSPSRRCASRPRRRPRPAVSAHARGASRPASMPTCSPSKVIPSPTLPPCAPSRPSSAPASKSGQHFVRLIDGTEPQWRAVKNTLTSAMTVKRSGHLRAAAPARHLGRVQRSTLVRPGSGRPTRCGFAGTRRTSDLPGAGIVTYLVTAVRSG
jgi:hypothetical protein